MSQQQIAQSLNRLTGLESDIHKLDNKESHVSNRLNIKRQNLDENSDIDEEGKDIRNGNRTITERVNGGILIKSKTPDSVGTISNKEVSNTIKAEMGNSGNVPAQNSINEIINQRIIGELDVETNYLRSSAQNIGMSAGLGTNEKLGIISDEMHMKTVF